MKKKNGFTLIELLAVIIILGILMIIAIPSVTKYISDSRKNSYVDSAKEIIGSARNLVNSGELEMYDTDATYYIDVNCIKTENAMKSPYGDFVKEGAYVVVTYDGKGYDYYWTSVDDAGQGIKNIVKYDKLDSEDISSDLSVNDINTKRTLDGRGKVILITERNSCKKEGAITENLIPVNSETGGNSGGNGGNTPTPSTTAAETILAAAQTAGQLNRIGTTDIYIFKGGTSNPPANYVSFNGELWRIIGIYNNQLKIQKSDALPSYLPYDNSSNETNVWSESSLRSNLNTSYFETLDLKSRNMIDNNAEWYVGDVDRNANAEDAYISSIELKWKGIDTSEPGIGLMTTYEFLYASDGDGCLTTSGYNYDGGCGKADKDWMVPVNNSWTISPIKGYNNSALYVYSFGYVFNLGVWNSNKTIPAVYLKPSVKITGGIGTSSNPYTFAM